MKQYRYQNTFLLQWCISMKQNKTILQFYSMEQVAIIQFNDLNGEKSLGPVIEQSYGSKGLGILFVRGIPGFVQLRKKLLLLTDRLGKLPKEVLAKCQRPQIFWTRGWSHGRQKFNGDPDFSKGSYYFKGVTNQAYKCPPGSQQVFSEFDRLLFSENVWLPNDLPELEKMALEFSKLLIQVGALLGKKIDEYLAKIVPHYPANTLEKMIKEGEFHVGRLLHYFPFEENQLNLDESNQQRFADWCGWHNDHGALTALTSALYTSEEGQQIKFPVQTGGLYAKGRNTLPTRIKIPADCLAFQIGESMQILSGGHLQATPHAVTKSIELSGKRISRNTFALFMQPNPLIKMKVPQGQDPKNVIENEAYKVPPIQQRWQNGQLFKNFHHETIMKYINPVM